MTMETSSSIRTPSPPEACSSRTASQAYRLVAMARTADQLTAAAEGLREPPC
ncbi:hypothetical protein [Actinomadura rugatobispora]|uniref:Uncharacterized protein n=1 Tax=Actinomadura rugatobispora TaxID=1994 RepID=A0ABW1A004_9ACTN